MEIGAPPVTLPWTGDRTGDRTDAAPVRLASVSHLAARADLARQVGLDEAASDGRLLAAAWRRWGTSAPARLTGPFALAVRAPGEDVVLARDHLGQIPLYYARTAAGVVVSTDLEAVLDHPEVGDDVDPEAAACRYAHAYLPLANRTPFRHVAKVPPATVVTVTRSSARERRYWDPADVAPQGGRPEEWVELMRAVLLEAVEDALPAEGEDGAVGAHVSGGLDSTAVAVLADRQLRSRGGRLAAVYSWSPAPGEAPVAAGRVGGRLVDERWLTDLTAAAEGWTVTYVPAQPQVAELIAADDPLRRPHAAWQREAWVARDAAARGLRVLLSGWGGDEAASFNGRNLVPWLARRGRVLAAYREVRDRARVTDEPADLRALVRPLIPSAVRGTVRRLGPSAAVSLTEARRQVWSAHDPFVREALEASDRLVGTARSPRELQVALLRLGHLAERCESWYACGGRAGVAYRFPLLDLRLVELALAAPAGCFRRDGWSRPCFRRAVEPFLPAAVVWNPVKTDPALNEVVKGRVDPAADPPPLPGLEHLDALARQARDLAIKRS